MDNTTTAEIDVGDAIIFIRSSGTGPPLLLLHGFPQTSLMWRDVAPILARHFTVICADLRGYGRSSCPPSTETHEPYSKRTMARDLVTVMDRLGFRRFFVAGHDRGGRVAYRLALDHPDRVDRLAVLDIVPTKVAWDHADARFALSFWPWSLLAQSEPLPERIVAAASDAIVDHALSGWDTPATVFSQDVRADYIASLRDPAHAHAICEEYRAAMSIDLDHDAEDHVAGRRITSPLLVMWSARGALASWYTELGGPIGLWQDWAGDVQGQSIEAGHFFPEEAPGLTADALTRFFGASITSESAQEEHPQ